MKPTQFNSLFLLFAMLYVNLSFASDAKIKETHIIFDTYPFYDESPLPNFGRIYPYSRIDGYSLKAQKQPWKAIILENKHIKVTVLPDVGGKVWSAIEKSTGKEFIYGNDAVKFRDIAIRGPWVSGGIEFNFGTVGHAQHTASPVDFITEEHDDGSVSVTVGDYDFASRTHWRVKISLKADSAFFETSGMWSNLSALPSSFYYWSNAAAKSAGNLELLTTGSNYISHDGDVSAWPIDKENRNIALYNNNDFGGAKSYHVANSYDGFLGGYWHQDNFGFGHIADFSQLPGKKIWIWGLSDQGNIWEDLLTDNAGQYIEWQAGRFLSQADVASAKTPFKPRLFQAHDVFQNNEYWFPIINTGGVTLASTTTALNIITTNQGLNLAFSPLVNKTVNVIIKNRNNIIAKKSLTLKAATPLTASFKIDTKPDYTISIAEANLYFDSKKPRPLLNRPTKMVDNTQWDSAQGLFSQGRSADAMRLYESAENFYLAALSKQKNHLQSLQSLATLFYRKGQYAQGIHYAKQALQHNTYDAQSNYVYGLLNMALGNNTEAKAAFALATSDTLLRSAAFVQLATLYARNDLWQDVEHYASNSLQFNSNNLKALELLAISQRLTNQSQAMKTTWATITKIDPTYYFVKAEQFLLDNTKRFYKEIHNEFPQQVMLELALTYQNLERYQESISLLKSSESAEPSINVMVNLWLSYLFDKTEQTKTAKLYLDKALTPQPNNVFPFRLESIDMLETLSQKTLSWKMNYYLALVYQANGRLKEALAQLNKPQNIPNFMPFYLVRSQLLEKNDPAIEQDLLQAIKYDINGWRPYAAIASYLAQQGEFKKSLSSAFSAQKNANNIPETITLYAATLIDNQQFTQAVAYLHKQQILPSEHSKDIIDLYHLASLNIALDSLKTHRLDDAIKTANQAKSWPKNLGAGRPYEVDEDIANYILALVHQQKGNKKQAEKFFNLVIKSSSKEGKINILLSTLASKQLTPTIKINTKLPLELLKKFDYLSSKKRNTALNSRSELFDKLAIELYELSNITGIK